MTFKKIILDILVTIIFIIGLTFFAIWLVKWYSLQGIFIFIAACVAGFWGWVIRWLYIDGRLTVSHILVIWLVATGTIMGMASYFLADSGSSDTLETLSRYVMVEVVAGSVGYFLKSGVEHSIWGGNLSAANKTASTDDSNNLDNSSASLNDDSNNSDSSSDDNNISGVSF